MAAINLDLTPIVTDSSICYFSPRPCHTPAKRLRSCLSPARTPTGGMTPARLGSSRTASFGSECSAAMADGTWRRTKSVRWEGEMEGCAVTSYHATWSATEYDRTPLEPPTEAERTCVLPERGSRTFTTTYDCFDDSPIPSSDAFETDEEEDHEDCPDLTSSPSEEISHESLVLATPLDSDCSYPEGDAPNEEDRQWEECMERRRMMFAMRARGEGHDRQPEFEGYRSISAKLADMLRSIESRRQPSPDEDDEEDEEEDNAPRGRVLRREPRIEEEEEDDEEDDEPQFRSYSSFTFTNLQQLNISQPSADEEASQSTEQTDSYLDGAIEPATPSLVSSSESEADAAIVSPRSNVLAPMGVVPNTTKDVFSETFGHRPMMELPRGDLLDCQ